MCCTRGQLQRYGAAEPRRLHLRCPAAFATSRAPFANLQLKVGLYASRPRLHRLARQKTCHYFHAFLTSPKASRRLSRPAKTKDRPSRKSLRDSSWMCSTQILTVAVNIWLEPKTFRQMGTGDGCWIILRYQAVGVREIPERTTETNAP